MDPQAALSLLVEAFQRPIEDHDDLDTLADAAEGLADWIRRGGFLPRSDFDVDLRVAMLRANQTHTKAAVLFARAEDALEDARTWNSPSYPASQHLHAVAYLLRQIASTDND